MNRRLSFAFALSFFGLISLAIAGESTAQGRFAMYVLRDRVPSTIQSLNDLKRFARSHQARELRETNADRPMSERRWEATLVITFPQTPPHYEYQIFYYDLTERTPRQIGGEEDVRVTNRGETTFVHDIRLPRGEFRPNKDIAIVIVVDRRELGRARVRLLGEVVQNSGEVDFTQPNPR
jgi:hypothetical protein